MKRTSAIFLQVVVVLIGIGALAFLLGEPHLEGRNANATTFEIYFQDPFLAFAYVASIPFFVAVYQIFKLLGYVGRDEVFSEEAIRAVRTVKYCAIAIIGFIAVSVVFIPFADGDDRPQGVVMRIFVALLTLIVAAAATLFERTLRNAVDGRSENHA